MNIPSRVPSDTWLIETLKGDVLEVVKFGFVGWGAETHGGGVGEICNCEGDNGDGICWCWCDTGSKTIGVSVVGFIMGDLGVGGSKICSEIMGVLDSDVLKKTGMG